LIRHGRPVPAGQQGEDGPPGPPLSLLGQRQAEAAGRALRAEPVQAVYASTMARAHGTAQIVADALGLTVDSRHDLREIDLLRPGGMPAEPSGERGWRAAASRFAECGRWDCWPHSEPSPAFRQRVRGVISDIAGRHASRAVAIVCHSGVVNACLADVLGLDRDYCVRPMHASLTRLRISAGRQVVTSVNETGHLPPELLTA